MPENALFASIVERLANDPQVQLSNWFGFPCAKLDGKPFAALYNESIVLKLGQSRVQKMLKAKEGKKFDPSGMGRPMKEWVVIEPPESVARERWLALAEEAKVFVASLS
ncbi:MAG: hypothetical protein FJ030_09250 [Chloroflexi bacterium]|nr:hypothetical protein [Chloroflexota bacterium]